MNLDATEEGHSCPSSSNFPSTSVRANADGQECPSSKLVVSIVSAEHPCQLLIDLNHLRIEVQAVLVHLAQYPEALLQFRLVARVVAVVLSKVRQLVMRDSQVALPRGVGLVGLG